MEVARSTASVQCRHRVILMPLHARDQALSTTIDETVGTARASLIHALNDASGTHTVLPSLR